MSAYIFICIISVCITCIISLYVSYRVEADAEGGGLGVGAREVAHLLARDLIQLGLIGFGA